MGLRDRQRRGDRHGRARRPRATAVDRARADRCGRLLPAAAGPRADPPDRRPGQRGQDRPRRPRRASTRRWSAASSACAAPTRRASTSSSAAGGGRRAVVRRRPRPRGPTGAVRRTADRRAGGAARGDRRRVPRRSSWARRGDDPVAVELRRGPHLGAGGGHGADRRARLRRDGRPRPPPAAVGRRRATTGRPPTGEPGESSVASSALSIAVSAGVLVVGWWGLLRALRPQPVLRQDARPRLDVPHDDQRRSQRRCGRRSARRSSTPSSASPSASSPRSSCPPRHRWRGRRSTGWSRRVPWRCVRSRSSP